MGLGLRVHSAPGITHRHMTARSDRGLVAGIGLIQIDVRGLNGQLAGLGQGIARVDGQMLDDPFELLWVGADAAETQEP